MRIGAHYLGSGRCRFCLWAPFLRNLTLKLLSDERRIVPLTREIKKATGKLRLIDFHHSVHTLLTGERTGYYIDFGKIEHLTKSLREGFVLSWQYSSYRKRHHGNPSTERPAYQFITFAQNHDQVGNRAFGERLSHLVPFEALKLAAGLVIFSPYIPLLFMGEEYGEESPFFLLCEPF